MKTPQFEQMCQDTFNLPTQLSPQEYTEYAPLISSMSFILSETKPLSLNYVTRSIEDALFHARPRTRYFVGWDARATYLLRNIFPDRVLDKLFTSLITSSNHSFKYSLTPSLKKEDEDDFDFFKKEKLQLEFKQSPQSM